MQKENKQKQEKKWTIQDEMWEWTIALILGFITGPVLFHFLKFINEPSLQWYELLLFTLFYRTVLRKSNFKIQKDAKEWIEVIVFAIFLVFNIRVFVIQNYEIPTGSMIPTFELKDRLFATRFNYWNSMPKRGDIIVFKFPIPAKISPLGPKKDVFVKRCIALEGETVEIKNKQVFVNGKPLDEPYKYHIDSIIQPANTVLQANPEFIKILNRNWQLLYKANPKLNSDNVNAAWQFMYQASDRDNMRAIVVPKGYLFAMGDNRDQSFDCRYWGFVPLENLKAKAWFLYWPFKRAKFVK